MEVRRTEGHNGGRFTKVRIGCDNSNRQPIVQVYFDGGAVHNAGKQFFQPTVMTDVNTNMRIFNNLKV